MSVKTIGQKTLLKYTAISVVTILILLTALALVFGQDSGTPLTMSRILQTYKNEFLDNLGFIVIQTILTLLTIWFVGGLCGRLIIEKRKNKFVIGGLSILLLWTSLFFWSTLTAGTMNSIKYGGQGFASATISWTNYGLIPYICAGLLHGLIMGFPVGHAIKKSGDKHRNCL